ncbi:hypothetical protein BSKO_08453 [Bryopsis sp. KO-2023]|nr:hypothetical protein BSKO_08453 [Bryopsis sp. KO-2023]
MALVSPPPLFSAAHRARTFFAGGFNRRVSLHSFFGLGRWERQRLPKPLQFRGHAFRATVMMAQPSKKGPKKTVKIFCQKCRFQLYKYRKGGTGSLVKCWHERIVEDYTNKDLKCPQCGTQFARSAMIRGKPANKIIGGKVYMKK